MGRIQFLKGQVKKIRISIGRNFRNKKALREKLEINHPKNRIHSVDKVVFDDSNKPAGFVCGCGKCHKVDKFGNTQFENLSLYESDRKKLFKK